MDKETLILMAEDDPGHAALTIKNLRRTGMDNEILHFRDGQELIEHLKLAEEENYSLFRGRRILLLLDIRMPRSDGFQVLRYIRSHKTYHNIPVIMLTTTDNPHEIEECHELGCNSYIVKPVDYDRFIEAVQRLGGFIKMLEIPRCCS